MLAYLNKQASISAQLLAVLMLALLPLRGKQALARDKRQDKKVVLPF
jgi:hypothetical protein